jgi:hypothetical protein
MVQQTSGQQVQLAERAGPGRQLADGRQLAAPLPRQRQPLVLMYHSVDPDPDDPYQVTVSPRRFEQQLSWLERRGLRGVSMAELLAARRRRCDAGLVGLTFDDGCSARRPSSSPAAWAGSTAGMSAARGNR